MASAISMDSSDATEADTAMATVTVMVDIEGALLVARIPRRVGTSVSMETGSKRNATPVMAIGAGVRLIISMTAMAKSSMTTANWSVRDAEDARFRVVPMSKPAVIFMSGVTYSGPV